MKFKYLKATLVGLCISLSSLVNAGLIVDQSFDSSNMIRGAGFSLHSISVFDDFSLANKANIEQISMWGGYWDSGRQPSSFDFRIQIRSSKSVSDVIYDTSITASNVTDTGFYHNNNNSADILKFDFDVTGLSLDAGTYIIGISAVYSIAADLFYWQRFDDNDPIVMGYFSSDIVTSKPFGDHALAIRESSTQVPEPSKLAIFALAIIGLASCRLKKQF